jgi:integrase
MNRHAPIEERAHGDENRAEERRRNREKEWRFVDRYLNENARDILLGQCPSQLSEQRIDELFAAVKKDASGYSEKLRHNYLADRLQKAALKHDLDLPNQQRMIVLHEESAPVTPIGFEELANLRHWMEGFWSDIESPQNRDNINEQKLDAGRLIVSFIVFGGVHSKTKLRSLIDAIPNGVCRLDSLTWMDIETNQGLWRWHPDPVSMLLLQRWYRTYGIDQWPTGVNTDVARLAFNYLRFLKMLKSKDKKSSLVLRRLMDASVTVDATLLEGAFHNIQRSLGATVSLPADSWARLMTKKVPPLRPEVLDEAKTRPIADLRRLTGQCDSDVFAGVRAIRRVLNEASRTSELGERDKTYQDLHVIADDESWAPIIRVLASWMAHLRRYGGRRQKRLAISSIKSYFSTIANPLAWELAGRNDLNALGEAEWQEVYDRLLAGASPGKQLASRANRAGWFHEYLVEQFGMPEVEIEGATVDGKVDADLLTPAEYVRTQKILEQSEASQRLIKIRQLVLTLGFRCGLRRTEVLKILVKDLQGLIASTCKRPELLTRSNKFAGQKSSSGTRRLPLWALLSKSELTQFREWYQYRLREPGTHENDLLFCAPQRGNELIPQFELFTPIQEAMRVASGTDSLRFHHLRHSCVSLIGLRLFERQPGELLKEDWAKDDDGNMVIPHWGYDIFAIANRSAEWAPTRKKLWFLALITGHASPGQTLASYSHLLDYGIGVRQAQRRLPALGTPAQANLLGSTPESVAVFRSRQKLKGEPTARELVAVANRRWPAGVCQTAGKHLIKFNAPDPKAHTERLAAEPYTAFMIYGALLQFNRLVAEGFAREMAIHKVAERFDLAAGALEAWLELGTSLMNQHARDGSRVKKYTRNPVLDAKQFPFKNGVGGTVVPELPECPAPPRSKPAHGLVEDIFEHVRRWLREEPESALYALKTVSDAITSSNTQIFFTRHEDKLTYREFIEKAGLMHLIKVRVKGPQRAVPDRELQAHWSQHFNVPKARVMIISQASKGNRFSHGSAQIEVRPDPKLGKGASQNTMRAVKFAVFILMLSCAGR